MNLVTFTEGILNGKLHFLWNEVCLVYFSSLYQFFYEEHNNECLLTKVEQFFECSFWEVKRLIISKLVLILHERLWIIVLENRPFFLTRQNHRKLVGSDKIFIKDAKNAENLNNFFSNTAKNLKIPECEEIKPFAKKQSSNIGNAEALFLPLVSPMGERFSFDVLVLMYLRK